MEPAEGGGEAGASGDDLAGCQESDKQAGLRSLLTTFDILLVRLTASPAYRRTIWEIEGGGAQRCGSAEITAISWIQLFFDVDCSIRANFTQSPAFVPTCHLVYCNHT